MIIMSVLLAVILQPVHAQNPPEINPRNVTLLIGFDSPSLQRCCESIALSHDGSMLAYSIDSFDVKSAGWKSFLSLYFFKNQTSRSLDLNNNLERIYDLNFSPDDKKLLFVGNSCDKKQSTTTYYVFSPSDIQLHCNTLSNINSVDWMPDGSIVILRNNEKNDTVSIYQNGTEKLLYEKQIEPPYISLNSSHIWSISTSPDGKKIALWYLVMFDHKTQILDVNTGKIITTVDGGHPEWSADSHTLSYTLPTSTGFLSNGARGVDTSINLLDVASNKTTALYHIPIGVDFTSITPDGTKVLYATNPSEPYKFFGIKAGIYAINLINGSNMTPSSIMQPMLIIESPLKQFVSGIAAKDVKCKQGLELLMKSHDNMPACVKSTSTQRLLEQGWINPYDFNGKYIGNESISISAYHGVSNETFYNNGTVVSDFTINVNINNFKPSNALLVLQVYYDDGILYKTVSVSSDKIQPDGFYKYRLIAVSDENHPAPFKVVATYGKETATTYAPVFAHP